MSKTSSKKQKAKKTEFSLLAPSVQSVFLAGDFNQWDLSSHPLKRDKNGMWKISLNLNPANMNTGSSWTVNGRVTPVVAIL